MHDELEAHLAAHGRLAKDGADIEQTDAAHFQQVLQQLGALALDGGLVDAEQIHRIVGHQAVAARDQLQAQLALAQARLAGDHHAQTQNVHEHAMHGGAVGEVLGQVSAQHVDDKRRRLVRGEHRDLRALAHRHQRIGCGLVVGQHEHRWFQRHDAGNAALTIVGGGVAQVCNLALAQDLDPVGVDVVEVADQVGAGTRGAHGHLVKAALGGPQARHPLPLQQATEFFEKDVGTDNIGLHGGSVSARAVWERCVPGLRQPAWTASLQSCRAVLRRRCRP